MNAMQELYRHYPEDDEIAAFYALALLGSTEGTRNTETYMQAAEIVEKVTSHNSEHPGAAHYAIHAYDDPIHASLGLRAACSYAKLAPGASHALHMPSHIFLALGMWDDVISSNQAAWEASIRHNPEGTLSLYMVHDLHALQWLSYAYLQKNDFQKSYQLVKLMEKIATSSMTPAAKSYYALMRAAYISESQNWTADLQPIDMTGIELSARSSDMYINVMIALNTERSKKKLKDKIEALERSYGTIPPFVPETEKHTDYFTSITNSGISAAQIAELEWRAQIKLHQGKKEEAIKDLVAANLLENQRSFGYGPPVPIKPAHELLGDVLLRDHQYRSAYNQYVMSLKRAPNRARSSDGLEAAQDRGW
jgi:tetratricopeptide (TPR) repeat protein